MTRPRRRPRETAADIAVPSWDIVGDFCEAIGRAGADLTSYQPAGPPRPPPRPRDWRALHPPPRPEPRRVRGLIYIYPWIGGDPPWGCAPCSPMGEGSEDTAVPPVDPAEARLHPEQIDVTPGEPDTADVARLQEERRYRWA
jgi:hypothetical protein